MRKVTDDDGGRNTRVRGEFYYRRLWLAIPAEYVEKLPRNDSEYVMFWAKTFFIKIKPCRYPAVETNGADRRTHR